MLTSFHSVGAILVPEVRKTRDHRTNLILQCITRNNRSFSDYAFLYVKVKLKIVWTWTVMLV
jgi:hypothetical protein